MALSGAEYLASIFGTEKDKVNCSFYFKIGACRHGEKCSRLHNKPTFSQTVLLRNLYHNPKLELGPADANLKVTPSDADEQKHFDEFFEEIFTEVEDTYGEVEEMNICDNIGEHMLGNCFIKFRREAAAERAEKELNNRWFSGRPMYAELSPVTDFREACCRQYEMGECMRGGFCNFMHLKPISYELRRELYNRNHPWKKQMRKGKRRGRKGQLWDFGPRNEDAMLSESLSEEPSPSLPRAYVGVCDVDSSPSAATPPRAPSLPAAFRDSNDLAVSPSSTDSDSVQLSSPLNYCYSRLEMF